MILAPGYGISPFRRSRAAAIGGGGGSWDALAISSDISVWVRAESMPDADGSAISSWTDLSGSGHPLLSHNNFSGGDPHIRRGVLNGKAVMECNSIASGAPSGFRTTYAMSDSGWSVFIVSALKASGQGRRTLTSDTNNWLLGTWNANVNSFYYEGDIHLHGDAQDAVWRIYEGHGDGAQGYAYTNGTFLGQNSGHAAPLGLTINGSTFVTNEDSDCYVAEIIAVPRCIRTTGEADAIRAGLNTEYGIF